MSNHFADFRRSPDLEVLGLHTISCDPIAGKQNSHFPLISRVTSVLQDSFYKEHSKEELELAFANEYDFDHPDAIDMPEFASVSEHHFN